MRQAVGNTAFWHRELEDSREGRKRAPHPNRRAKGWGKGRTRGSAPPPSLDGHHRPRTQAARRTRALSARRIAATRASPEEKQKRHLLRRRHGWVHQQEANGPLRICCARRQGGLFRRSRRSRRRSRNPVVRRDRYHHGRHRVRRAVRLGKRDDLRRLRRHNQHRPGACSVSSTALLAVQPCERRSSRSMAQPGTARTSPRRKEGAFRSGPLLTSERRVLA